MLELRRAASERRMRFAARSLLWVGLCSCGGSSDSSPVSDQSSPARIAPVVVRYTTEPVNMRRDTTARSAIVETLGANVAVEVLSCDYRNGARCAITYANQSGFVPKRYLTESPLAAVAIAPRRAVRAPAVRPEQVAPLRTPRAQSSGYYTGPRGGCYTYSASGRKRYVDRSYCR